MLPQNISRISTYICSAVFPPDPSLSALCQVRSMAVLSAQTSPKEFAFAASKTSTDFSVGNIHMLKVALTARDRSWISHHV